MWSNHLRTRGVVGMAFGALLASPLISLIAGPVATADPAADAAAAGQIVTLGPFPFDGFADTLAFNDSTFAFDNYLTGTVDGSVFNLDVFFGAPGSNSYEVLLTDPGLFQLGVVDVDGSVRFIDNFIGSDFLPTDPGLAELGGVTGLNLGADMAAAVGLLTS
jgi:hypothetical protein